MVSVEKLKARIKDLGLSVPEVSKECGMSTATLYRRLSVDGIGSAFSVVEVDRICRVLKLSDAERNAIFFANELSKTKNKRK